eukprot:Gregarina_sp_Poly_1__4146@NODE_226_length_11195_cov_150_303648_g200_i0_p1_GENE_NODE_226_length_11195_cov_150_303648_g200_i0NODE_226_length_11195_cov_150_303648_g200_i0_p1_ORF_typecomplete_len1008_score179_44ABC_tran/PF00005_27/2_1e21ABC2_membrane/PF01061_24/1_5e02ABC2_membrane/PF01061_24/3_6e17AAA_15/PF13175_6/1_1e06AAA_15/PF13175_6/6_1e02AAA_21/PF13304_6/5_8e06AAA_21/PF13304_6/1e03SMC_N/PF02463_19/0_76SMC_N/PF02463_19/0_023RsgA_GTPase/PF03193_16/0_00068AAA_29/PF13555_6/0_0014AAA_10/PF12846_7/0_
MPGIRSRASQLFTQKFMASVPVLSTGCSIGCYGVSFAASSTLRCNKNKSLILKDVSCVFEAGKITGIIGPSGCGKTTLLNLLNGRLKPITGSIRVWKEETSWKSMRHFEKDTRSECRYVSASDHFAVNANAMDCLRQAIKLQRGTEWLSSKSSVSIRVNEALRRVDILESAETKLSSLVGEAEASGGEKKRTSLAIELCSVSPGQLAFLFCDEPTTSLDTHMALLVMHQLRTFIDDNSVGGIGVTLHQPSIAMLQMLDVLIIMAEGRVVFHGSPQSAMASMEAITGIHHITNTHRIVGEDLISHVVASKYSAEELNVRWRQTIESQALESSLVSTLEMPVSRTKFSWKVPLKALQRFVWEVKVITVFVWRTFHRNLRIILGLCFVFILEGIILGLLFNNSFKISHGQKSADIISNLENNTLRSIHSLANDQNPITDFFQNGVHGDLREDPLASLAKWPSFWRWAHRTFQTGFRDYDLAADYPDRWYLLQEEDPTWRNDYRDLRDVIGKKTNEPFNRNLSDASPVVPVDFVPKKTKDQTQDQLETRDLQLPTSADGLNDLNVDLDSEPADIDKEGALETETKSKKEWTAMGTSIESISGADKARTMKMSDPRINERNTLEETLNPDFSSLISTATTDRDLDWDSLNVFTPRFIITEGAGILSIWDHVLGKTDWEMIPRHMPPPYGVATPSGLLTYLMLLATVYPPVDPLLQATGLPRVALIAARSETEKEIATDTDKETETSSLSQGRRLFLEIDEEWPLLQDARRILDLLPIPGIYDMGIEVVRDTIDGMSATACLFFLTAATGFSSLVYLFVHYSYRLAVNRDAANRHYGLTAFYVALNIALLPWQVASAIFISLPFVTIAGFDAAHYLPIIGVTILVTVAMFSVSKLVCCCTSSLQQAVRVVPLALVFLVLFSGFFIRSGNLSSAFHPWLSSLSPYRWGLFAFVLVAVPPGEITHRVPHEWLLGVNGVEARSVGHCCLILLGLILAFRTAGGVAFKWFNSSGGTL